MKNLIDNARQDGMDIIQVCALIHIGDELFLLERTTDAVYEFVTADVLEDESLTQALQRAVILETGANIESVESYLAHRDEMRGEKKVRQLIFVLTLVDPYDIRSLHHSAFAWRDYKEAIGYPITNEDRETIDLFGKWREATISRF
jgi:hypothetical protein